jgi:Tfp pilus assembly protein PilF
VFNSKRQTQPALRWQLAGVCLVLAAITFAVFGQTLHHEFINYDDDKYVYYNPVVAKGLTLQGVVWALSYGEIGHWHPLTWISHMLDCQFYGLNPGGPHLSNVALHAAAAVVLFLALRELTGSLWRSAFVAAFFAIHPLRVESVAWVAERKDVLSGVFFMLALWAYGRYARQLSHWRYALVAAAQGLGLLCKNTLVTLPFVLLLLDWWPLERLTPGSFWGLVKEKIPLILLSAGSCVATFLVPEKVFGPGQTPLLERVANVVVSYGIYLRQMVYPAGLAIPYINPPSGLPFWEIALSLAVLAAISISVLACRKGRPYLLVGWLWYLGMLVPAIGLIEISYYSHADRYTYLPGIGLVLAGTWTVGDWSAGWKHRRTVLGSVMAAVIGALMICAWTQTGYWKNSETLWAHTLACTTGNYLAHSNLGNALVQTGKVDEAIAHYQSAVQINPRYVDARFNLGNAYLQKGNADKAITQYQKALEIQPDYAVAHLNLGNGFSQQGRLDQAISQYQAALEIQPAYAEAHFNLGICFGQLGRMNEAISEYQKALETKPDHAEARYNLGLAFARQGRMDEAISEYQRALKIKPDYAEAHLNLGICLGQRGKTDEAISQYQKALEIKPDCAEAHNDLGICLCQQQRMTEAVAQFQRALEIKPDYAEARHNLGNSFFQQGRMDEAISQYQKTLEIQPADATVQNILAWLLATCAQPSQRNGNRAVELARQANASTGGKDPDVLRTLAAAFAEAGRFGAARESAQKAIESARAKGQTGFAEQLGRELKRYEAGLPWHQ